MIDESAYPQFVLDILKQHASNAEELEDLLYQWDERCGIRHYDGGMPLLEAEKEALKEVVARLGPTGHIEEKEL